MTAFPRFISGTKTFVNDVVEGFFAITHNGLALLGLAVACMAMVAASRPDLRVSAEAQLFDWLRTRHVVAQEQEAPAVADAGDRALAINPHTLPKEQAAIAFWLSKKYRVAPEPVSALVAQAYDVGLRTKIEPTLLLAVIAVESSFNPFAQSAVGAQGLMQVMTRTHTDKYENFGGHLAAFDPQANLRVGAKVLQECIQRAGSVEGGLRYYVGAANQEDDGGYTAKVLAEQARLRQIAGRRGAVAAAPKQLAARAQPQPAPIRPAGDATARNDEGVAAAPAQS
ncbi:lytic transglycosylase domain-containing protein [Extensimonas sp. H3M7-6]|uniref:lytic transglycosylase domain-containing protein n=1 Tax=Extensimonas soli TaxID=3031322 RepID=UPI0023D9B6DD|nr:lytic transglycosylase domain-containing protein [Extensimonas sp. H3M7-6]MDF1481616.1 lytic transglycosylase domain-containing protein [Extensimonas sp. H3M7-6]